jgi:aminoglycoside 6'-N-acetyltransferase
LAGKGHGPVFTRRFCDRLFAEGAFRIFVDPNRKNAVAIRARAKAGLEAIGEVTTNYGRVLVMARNHQEIETR